MLSLAQNMHSNLSCCYQLLSFFFLVYQIPEQCKQLSLGILVPGPSVDTKIQGCSVPYRLPSTSSNSTNLGLKCVEWVEAYMYEATQASSTSFGCQTMCANSPHIFQFHSQKLFNHPSLLKVKSFSQFSSFSG